MVIPNQAVARGSASTPRSAATSTADDDESVYRAARDAAADARKKLGQARTVIGPASTAFRGRVGLASGGSIGDKLHRRKACAARYKELQSTIRDPRSAIRDAEAAIARAEAACDPAMTRPRPYNGIRLRRWARLGRESATYHLQDSQSA
jgi:hypothetical protein